MVIFNSYIKLPEGKCGGTPIFKDTYLDHHVFGKGQVSSMKDLDSAVKPMRKAMLLGTGPLKPRIKSQPHRVYLKNIELM